MPTKNSKRNNTHIYVIIGISVVAVLAVSIYLLRGSLFKTGNIATDGALPKASPGAAIQSSPVTSPTPTIQSISAPSTSSTGTMTITKPTEGGTIASGSVVAGNGPKPNSQIFYSLKGGQSGELALGQTTTDKLGAFSFAISFMNDVSGGSDQGVLEVYEQTASGARTNIATVNVNIKG